MVFIHDETPREEKNFLLNMLKNTNARVEVNYFKVHTKNALDFKICTELGIQATKYKNKADHYIVSHDKGYSAAIEHMERLGIKCYMVTSIQQKNEVKLDSETLTAEDILTLYPHATKKFIKLVIKTLVMSSNTAQLNENIQKNLNDRSAYSKLKPLYLQKMQG